MSEHLGVPIEPEETQERDTTGRWVWGSIGLAFCLWVVAACTPWLNNWLGSRGQIGDFLGGIAAPIFGFVGMVLVYRSFQAQVKANQLQIDALNAERKAREGDEAAKFLQDGLRRLEKILDRTCYSKRSGVGGFQLHHGQDGIYRFCVDCSHNQGGYSYSENEIILDVMNHWFFEASLLLRIAGSSYPRFSDQVVMDVERLYVFTLAKSLNTLLKPEYREGEFSTALNHLKSERERFLLALQGHFS